MKSFQEFAYEKVFNELAAAANAFAGGVMQRARNQSFNPTAAIKSPYGLDNPNNAPKTYDSFLDSHQQKVQQLQQWMNQAPYNMNVISQHYGRDLNRFQTDMDRAMKSYVQDDSQTDWPAYVQKTLNLPQGSFH